MEFISFHAIRSVIVAAVLAVVLVACDGYKESSDAKDQKNVDKQNEQYAIAQPVPQFDYSLERDVYIQLYKARNQNVATHTVWRSDFGQVLGECPSIGYPIPFDSSLTNPLKIGRKAMRGGGGAYDVLEQAEPNGLYPSKNSVATWVRCVVEINSVVSQVPIYVEDKVTAYPYPVDVDYETDRVTIAGAPSVTLTTKE